MTGPVEQREPQNPGQRASALVSKWEQPPDLSDSTFQSQYRQSVRRLLLLMMETTDFTDDEILQALKRPSRAADFHERFVVQEANRALSRFADKERLHPKELDKGITKTLQSLASFRSAFLRFYEDKVAGTAPNAELLDALRDELRSSYYRGLSVPIMQKWWESAGIDEGVKRNTPRLAMRLLAMGGLQLEPHRERDVFELVRAGHEMPDDLRGTLTARLVLDTSRLLALHSTHLSQASGSNDGGKAERSAMVELLKWASSEGYLRDPAVRKGFDPSEAYAQTKVNQDSSVRDRFPAVSAAIDKAPLSVATEKDVRRSAFTVLEGVEEGVSDSALCEAMAHSHGAAGILREYVKRELQEFGRSMEGESSDPKNADARIERFLSKISKTAADFSLVSAALGGLSDKDSKGSESHREPIIRASREALLPPEAIELLRGEENPRSWERRAKYFIQFALRMGAHRGGGWEELRSEIAKDPDGTANAHEEILSELGREGRKGMHERGAREALIAKVTGRSLPKKPKRAPKSPKQAVVPKDSAASTREEDPIAETSADFSEVLIGRIFLQWAGRRGAIAPDSPESELFLSGLKLLKENHPSNPSSLFSPELEREAWVSLYKGKEPKQDTKPTLTRFLTEEPENAISLLRKEFGSSLKEQLRLDLVVRKFYEFLRTGDKTVAIEKPLVQIADSKVAALLKGQ